MLQSFKQYCKTNPYVDKVIQSSATFKRGAIQVTERRLWVYFNDSHSPVLMKEDWLTGNNEADLTTMFKAYMQV